MKTFIRYATAATLAGALAVAMATPSQARYWHHGGGAAVAGFAAGALVGAAAANAYGPGYYYDDGYAYAPGPYSYGYDSYAYDPGPYRSYRYSNSPPCAGDLGNGRADYSSC